MKFTVLISIEGRLSQNMEYLSLSTRSASAGPAVGWAIPDDAVRDG